MKNRLKIVVGQYSNKGRKSSNQDFYDLVIPNNDLLITKGIVVAVADGISSSKVSGEASKIAVVNFLQDYYATSESWSVEKSLTTVICAINSWLYSQNRKNLYHLDKDKGYVTTFSGMVLKSTLAHIFHVGDIRIYKLRNGIFEQLTQDHRTWISNEKSYLSRALGIDSIVNIDYTKSSLEQNDIFILSTDGVYEHIELDFIKDTLNKYPEEYDTASKIIIDRAYENGSEDNLTIQLIKIESLPNKDIKEIHHHLYNRPIPHILKEGEVFDGYKITSVLSYSSRSHVYLAYDEENNNKVVIKIPSTTMQNDEAYLESFLLEEWVAKRVNNLHIAKSYNTNRKSNYLYTVMEYIEGVSLAQWLIDNAKPSLNDIRNIANQIAKGLLAFHRQEMIHQDIRPKNIMIDTNGIVKIIDFGSIKIKGIEEIDTFIEKSNIQGTALYTAPEYFIGNEGTYQSDLFSLAVIVYEMLSGKFPYGTNIAKTSTKSEQNRLTYNSLYPQYPIWIDETLKKALHIEPTKRYTEFSEFLYDLEKPNKKFFHKTTPPLLQRDPEKFWKILALIEAVVIIFILFMNRV